MHIPLRALATFGMFTSAAVAHAQLVTYNSGFPEENASVRANFYTAVGISGPQFLVDFETGFTDEQNISGRTGLFPRGLVIRDTSATPQAIIQQGPGSIESSGAFGTSPSNPVGSFALTHTPNGGSDLILDFSSNPVDYVAFQDLDTDENNSRIVLTFVGGSTQLFALPDSTRASGDTAEFLGFFRKDLPQITQLRLDFSGVTFGVDNLEYGVVPEPSGVLLAGIGALALLGGRPRRHGTRAAGGRFGPSAEDRNHPLPPLTSRARRWNRIGSPV